MIKKLNLLEKKNQGEIATNTTISVSINPDFVSSYALNQMGWFRLLNKRCCYWNSIRHPYTHHLSQYIPYFWSLNPYQWAIENTPIPVHYNNQSIKESLKAQMVKRSTVKSQ